MLSQKIVPGINKVRYLNRQIICKESLARHVHFVEPKPGLCCDITQKKGSRGGKDPLSRPNFKMA